MPQNTLLALVRDTVNDPRGGASRILEMHLPEAVLWQALMAVVSVSVLLTELGELIIATPVDPLMPVFLQNPLLTAAVQFGLLVVMVYAIHFIGRAVGGVGQFAGALALTVWLQVILIFLQLLQTVFLFVLPAIASLIGVFGVGLFFWLLSHFVAVLHGFPSVLKTFAGIVASMVGIVFGMSLIMSILGITFSGALPDV